MEERGFRRLSDGAVCRGFYNGWNFGFWTVVCTDGTTSKFPNIRSVDDPHEFDIMSDYECMTWQQEGEDMVFRWADNGDVVERVQISTYNERHSRYGGDEHSPKWSHQIE